MMRQMRLNITIEADPREVLKHLRENRDRHGDIVKEARPTYLMKARAAIEKRLKQLESGKVVALHFSLSPPGDFTTVYDTAIRALEMHTGETITLTADQVRYFIEDEWDWMEGFLTSNSGMSSVAAKYAATKGYDSP